MDNKKTSVLKKSLIIILIGILPVFYFMMAKVLSAKNSDIGSLEIKKESSAIIKSIIVREGGGVNAPQSLTPWKDYDIKIMANNNSGIGNPDKGLDELIVKLWYDKGGDDVFSEEELNKVFLESGNKLNPQNCLNIRWVRGGKAALSGGGETWELDLKKSVLPNKQNDGDTTFEFIFNIKIGKIAKEASIDNKWQIAARVSGVDGSVDHKVFKSITGIGLPMDFYGEIGMDECNIDINNPSKKDLSGNTVHEVSSIKYLCNSNYDELVKANNVWMADNSGSTMQMLSDAEKPNSFSIKSNSINDIKTSEILPVDQTYMSIKKNIPESTSENPEFKSNFLYISLNPDFDKTTSYRGTITYGIANNVN